MSLGNHAESSCLLGLLFNIQIKITQATAPQNVEVCGSVLYIPWEELVFSLSLIVLFSSSQGLLYFAQVSFLDLALPSFNFFLLFQSLQVVQANSPRLPPNSKFPSLLTFSGRTTFPSSSHLFCPPLSLTIPLPSPENHTLFSSTKRTTYLCHKMLSISWKWKWAMIFFFWRSISSHSREKIIPLTSTSASVPQHILFPLPGTASTLLPTPFMAHTSYPASSLTQVSPSPSLGTCLLTE